MSDITQEIKDQLKSLSSNLNKINELEAQIGALKASTGVADLKEQVAKISQNNATIVDTIKSLEESVQKRQDEFEVKMKEQGMGAGSRKGFAEAAVKSLAEQGMSSASRFKGGAAIDAYKALGLKGVTNLAGSGGPLLVPEYVPGIVRPGEQEITLLDVISTIPTTQASVIFMRELAQTGGAATRTVQTAAYAETDFTFQAATVPVVDIGHFAIVSNLMLDDREGLQAYLDSRMVYLTRYAAEGKVLKGPGGAAEMSGINTQATAFDVTLPAALDIALAQRIDLLRAAMVQSGRSLFPATAHILNPEDWAAIELTKDKDGKYLFAQPQGSVGPRMWGLPVISTYQQTLGKFTVGNMTPLALQLHLRQQADLQISTEDSDNFRKNLATIRSTVRAALTVYRPTAIVLGDFDILTTT